MRLLRSMCPSASPIATTIHEISFVSDDPHVLVRLIRSTRPHAPSMIYASATIHVSSAFMGPCRGVFSFAIFFCDLTIENVKNIQISTDVHGACP